MTGASGRGEWQAQLAALLNALAGEDDRWHVVPSAGAVTLTRGWQDGTVETVVLVSPGTAYAMRDNGGGIEEWSIAGTAEQVVDEVGKRPLPAGPDAPGDTRHSPRPSGQWM